VKRFAELARSAAALATGQLGWAPQQFWDSTVFELRTALDGRAGPNAPAPLARAELAALETKEASDG
jgi:hypothetical protein